MCRNHSLAPAVLICFMFITVGVYSQTRVCSPVDCALPSDKSLDVCPAVIASSSSSSAAIAHYNRCSDTIDLNFCVMRRAAVNLSYSYELIRDSDNKTVATDSGSLDKVSSPILVEVHTKNKAATTYHVSLTVSEGPQKAEPKMLGPIEVARHSKTRGLAIGISHYLNPDIRVLNFADQDAKSFYDLATSLIKSPDVVDIRLMRNEEATRDAIKAEIENIEKDHDFCENDQFVFFYSGHGFLDGGHYLGTYNVDPTKLEDTGFYMPFLLHKIDHIGPSPGFTTRKLLIFDSCFGGFSDKAPEPSASSKNGVKSAGKEEAVTDGTLLRGETTVQESDTALEDMRRELTHLFNTEATILSASEANVPAEEGAVLIGRDDHRFFFFVDEVDKTKLPTLTGHGLYTYFLLGNLERQLSSSSLLDVTGDHRAQFKPTGDCKLSFAHAHQKASNEISEMIKDPKLAGRKIQEPREQDGRSPLRDWVCPSQ
jgi:hypothetical protein